MKAFRPLRQCAVLACLVLGFACGAAAHAVTVTVPGTASLFNTTGSSAPGTPAVLVSVAGLTAMSFEVSAGHTISYNIGTGSNFNNADGMGSVSDMVSSGGSGISGITAPNAGFLAGVFFAAKPGASAPAALNFLSAGTAFASLSPLLQQSFFIGDGLTGNASGAVQTFNVPVGATTLYLGFIDACGYRGSPSCYDDNAGSLGVTTQSADVRSVPEVPSALMLATGLALLPLWRVGRRRLTA